MSNPYIGQIIAVGFNFAPPGWNLCDGSLLSISENSVLYTLIGTTYGGNGTTDFAVPDLRGRSPLNQGQGNGLTNRVLGEPGGTDSVNLVTSETPVHTHTLNGSGNAGTAITPGPTVSLGTGATPNAFGPGPGNTTLAAAAIGLSAGGATPHENRQPYTVLNYIISTQGIFPSQG